MTKSKQPKETISAKPIVWIVDTSVLMNILDIPNYNQDRPMIFEHFKQRVSNKDKFLLPYIAILEAGNHIAQLPSNRYGLADKFIKYIKDALDGTAPWTPLNFPNQNDINNILLNFPNMASKKIGFGDCAIINEWKIQKNKFPNYSIRVWTIDSGLQDYTVSED